MEGDNVIALRQPGDIADPLTEVCATVRALLAKAVEAEVAEALAPRAHLTTDDGGRRLVRHGPMPERTIQTGIGPVAVRQPRVRDRAPPMASASGFPQHCCRATHVEPRASTLSCRCFTCAGSLRDMAKLVRRTDR